MNEPESSRHPTSTSTMGKMEDPSQAMSEWCVLTETSFVCAKTYGSL
jgi:hypothetical protein